jgi:hypothetical protein
MLAHIICIDCTIVESHNLSMHISMHVFESRNWYWHLSNSIVSHCSLFFFFCFFLVFYQNPGISGVVLEDFDSSFVNKFYHSYLDDLCELTCDPGIIFFLPV